MNLGIGICHNDLYFVPDGTLINGCGLLPIFPASGRGVPTEQNKLQTKLKFFPAHQNYFIPSSIPHFPFPITFVSLQFKVKRYGY